MVHLQTGVRRGTRLHTITTTPARARRGSALLHIRQRHYGRQGCSRDRARLFPAFTPRWKLPVISEEGILFIDDQRSRRWPHHAAIPVANQAYPPVNIGGRQPRRSISNWSAISISSLDRVRRMDIEPGLAGMEGLRPHSPHPQCQLELLDLHPQNLPDQSPTWTAHSSSLPAVGRICPTRMTHMRWQMKHHPAVFQHQKT